jgi:protein O-mannosyl-transferase
MHEYDSRLPPLPSRSTLLWVLVGFFIVAFAVYGASVVHNNLVLWDDNHLIYFNPHIRSFAWSNIVHNFTHFDPELYVPLTFLSFQLDHFLGGMSPAIYHFTNLVLHTLNASMVGLLLYVLLRRGWIAVMLGLLFLVHPLHTEAVAWASARKDILSTFFFLISTLLYLHATADGHRRSYWLSLVTFFLGLLSKVMIITLPLVLVLLDVLRGRRMTRSVLREKIPYILLSSIFGAVALYAKQETVSLLSGWETAVMGLKSAVFYLEKFVLPLHLSVLYPFTGAITLASPAFYIPLLVLLGLGVLSLWALRFSRIPLLAYLFYLITLVPTFFNVAKAGEIYVASDRYAYIPSIGLFLFLGWCLSLLVPEGSHRREKPWKYGLGMAAVILALLANRQAAVWRDSESLFEHAIGLYPDTVAARLNLAMVYRQTNREKEAIEQLNEVLKRREHPRVYTAMATIRETQGSRAEAYALYRKAASIDPTDAEPHLGIGLLAMRDGNKELAIREYHQALKLHPNYATVHLNLATLHLQYEELDKAAGHYRHALVIDPYITDAHFNLGVIQQEQGNLEGAVRSLETVIDIDPRSIDAYERLATLYLKLQRTKDAVHAVRTMNHLAPNDEDAKFLLQTFRKHGLMQD